jgi:hypothetical protein
MFLCNAGDVVCKGDFTGESCGRASLLWRFDTFLCAKAGNDGTCSARVTLKVRSA